MPELDVAATSLAPTSCASIQFQRSGAMRERNGYLLTLQIIRSFLA